MSSICWSTSVNRSARAVTSRGSSALSRSRASRSRNATNVANRSFFAAVAASFAVIAIAAAHPPLVLSWLLLIPSIVAGQTLLFAVQQTRDFRLRVKIATRRARVDIAHKKLDLESLHFKISILIRLYSKFGSELAKEGLDGLGCLLAFACHAVVCCPDVAGLVFGAVVSGALVVVSEVPGLAWLDGLAASPAGCLACINEWLDLLA